MHYYWISEALNIFYEAQFPGCMLSKPKAVSTAFSLWTTH